MTNLLSRPAPILARTITGLSRISGGRVILALGAGGMEEEIVALGVPRLSPGARIRAPEEAIMVVRALSGSGDPVTFDGEFYQVTELTPATAPTPPIWIGSGGPKGLAVTGRHADGWVPPHLADWRSTLVAESRSIIDEAAASVGRNPAAGSLTPAPSSTSSRTASGGRLVGCTSPGAFVHGSEQGSTRHVREPGGTSWPISVSSSTLGAGSSDGPDRSGRTAEREVSFASVGRCVTLRVCLIRPKSCSPYSTVRAPNTSHVDCFG